MISNTEKSRIRRERYPDRVRSYLNAWRKANPDKVKEYNRQYYERRKALRQEQKGSGEDA